MSPNPDFGYDTYKGYGRLAGKVASLPFIEVQRLMLSDICLLFANLLPAFAVTAGTCSLPFLQ